VNFAKKNLPWILAAALAASGSSVSAERPLEMAFDGDSVVVSGLAPGAEIVYFSIHRFNDDYVPRTLRRDELLTDDDGDGEVRVALDRSPTGKFLAVAAELSSGRFAVLTPEGRAHEIAFPAHSLSNGNGNRLDRLENGRQYVELLLVRPGEQPMVWGLTTGDGHATDETPPNDGVVITSLASMWPLDGVTPPPEEYAKDDLLVRVAPRELEYYAVRIVKNQ